MIVDLFMWPECYVVVYVLEKSFVINAQKLNEILIVEFENWRHIINVKIFIFYFLHLLLILGIHIANIIILMSYAMRKYYHTKITKFYEERSSAESEMYMTKIGCKKFSCSCCIFFFSRC